MSRSLPIALFILGLTAAGGAQAEVLTTKGNELFCRDRSKFPEYLAVMHNKQFNYHTVEGCRQPAKGTRYEVLEEAVETGIDKIRLFVGRRPTEGYLLVQGDSDND
jgi:hypothetical protein